MYVTLLIDIDTIVFITIQSTPSASLSNCNCVSSLNIYHLHYNVKPHLNIKNIDIDNWLILTLMHRNQFDCLCLLHLLTADISNSIVLSDHALFLDIHTFKSEYNLIEIRS